jgi:hypothetical protein
MELHEGGKRKENDRASIKLKYFPSAQVENIEVCIES